MMSTVCEDVGAIRHVSDTALWVAMYRAFESERPDAIFHDPYARQMAGARGAEIVKTMPFGQSMVWAMVVRTAVMDEIILRCVAQGARTIVNLGAGLDTRAFRLPLPADLRWLDVDLPDMIDHRRECLRMETAACKHSHVAADLTDAASVDQLLRSAGRANTLVITEGVLVYMTQEQVAALARKLCVQCKAKWWLTDLIAPMLLNLVGTHWNSQLASASAPFRFAPDDSTAFFDALGWKELEFRSTWDESIRLQRTAPMAHFWNTWSLSAPRHIRPKLSRMSGIALLEQAQAGGSRRRDRRPMTRPAP